MYTLSIILNLHREGELTERTIQNLKKIIQTYNQSTNQWKEVEILAILDNPDEKTKNIVYDHKEIFSKIEEVDFKDLAHSRNHGVSQATKDFILFADGDDYFSHNVLEKLYITFTEHYTKTINTTAQLKQLPDNQHIAVFPHYYIEFPNLLQAEYFNSTDFTIQNNKFLHCFGSRIAIYKGILERYKVHENKSPYGYEDWDLNNRLLANGIQYKISNHKLYYRRESSQSLLAMQVKNKNIVRNSLLYDYTMINNDLQNEKIEAVEPLPQERGLIWRRLSKSNTLRKIYHFMQYGIKHLKQLLSFQDKSLFEEDISFLKNYGENISFRKDLQTYSLEYYASNLSIQTKAYNQIMEFLLHKEIVYFFPWVVVGGADKISVEYTKVLSTKNSCVITSISSGVRINHIKIPHLDFVSEIAGWKDLSEDDQLHILIKSLINSKIKLVHIVNSEIALKTVKYYKKVYNEYNIKTIISLFCPEYHWENKEWHGYPVMYPELFKNSDLILLDNHYWYDFFKKLNNKSDFRYEKLSSPTEKIDISYNLKTYDTKKILWASRICNQKLFDVFEEIVALLPEYTFVIYGSVIEEDHHNKAILDRLVKKDNTEFRGEYKHISEINLNEFDLYLFTSLYEGIPTIILDMVMSGIPIVTADVGGISEVLGKDYPLLVKNPSIAKDYVSEIEKFYKNKHHIVQSILSIRDIVIENYNEKTFHHEYNTLVQNLLNDH